LTVATPSLTSHLAGPPSFSLFHCDKSFPSNNTMASDGGGPGSMTRGSALSGVSPPSPAEELATAQQRIIRQTADQERVLFIISLSNPLPKPGQFATQNDQKKFTFSRDKR
jgi:hypothetical protein